MQRSIAIISGKGGTGKTTLAINLALALQRLKENTLLVDANLKNPHVGLSLGDGIYRHTIHDVMEGRIAFTQAVQYHSSGIKFVPGALNVKEPENKFHLRKFSKSANWVLFDSPPGNAEHVLNHTDQVMIVTNPQIPALTDTYRLLQEAKEKQKIVAGVIVNNVGRHDLKTDEIEKFLGQSVAAVIPKDEYFDKALVEQEPFIKLYPTRPASYAIRELAARLANKPVRY